MIDECFNPGDIIRYKTGRPSALFAWVVDPSKDWDSPNPFMRVSSTFAAGDEHKARLSKENCNDSLIVLSSRLVDLDESYTKASRSDGKHEFILILRPGELGPRWYRRHLDAFEKV